MKHRVGFLTTHPIQYQAPVFRHLATLPDLDFTVFFCQLPDARTQGDGFGTSFIWDVPLLDGYRYEVLNNVSKHPSVTAFSGCDTPDLHKRIKQGGFDAFVVNGWVVKSCLQALWACRRSGVPCIVRGEANNLRPRPWWKRLVQRQLVRRYSACLYIGNANARFYRSYDFPEHLLFPAKYCVDNDRFSTSAEAILQSDARKSFNLSADSTVFLFSGKLIQKKHPLEFLTAVKNAVQRDANLEVLIVGDGELKDACHAFVKEWNLPVTFTGFLNQSKVVQAYVAADCLVLPSDHGETWGLVVNEAMACGRPAIVSDQVGCSEDLVIPNTTGRIFEFGNWQQLTDILVETAVDSAWLKTCGAAARRRIEDYSPEAAARGIAEAVRNLSRKTTVR